MSFGLLLDDGGSCRAEETQLNLADIDWAVPAAAIFQVLLRRLLGANQPNRSLLNPLRRHNVGCQSHLVRSLGIDCLAAGDQFDGVGKANDTRRSRRAAPAGKQSD